MAAPEFPKRNYAKRDPLAKRDPPAKRVDVRERQPRRTTPAPRPAAPTAWERTADWYDQHQGEGGDDFYTTLVLPAVLRQLDAIAGQRVLDVCCGQGVLGRALAARQIRSLGVDASPSLIDAARSRAGGLEAYVVGDARALEKAVSDRSFDHAALVMALQDVDRLPLVLAGTAALIKTGGRVVIVLSHPCFRIIRRSSWGWDEENGVQYRRLDGYLSPQAAPVRTHPGDPDDTRSTASFHRPLSAYLNGLGAAGLAVVACDELCSHRRGTRGPRFAAEDRAAKEFPLFLVLTAVKLPMVKSPAAQEP